MLWVNYQQTQIGTTIFGNNSNVLHIIFLDDF